MTAQRDADIDIESLRKSARRPLDTFLIISIIFLFMVVAAVVAVIILMVKQPQVIALPHKGEPLAPTYKMDNFVYLEATSSKVENTTMSWAVKEFGEGTSKGSLFDFYPGLQCLQPRREGMYFLYLNLNFTCTLRNYCSPGRLTVQVADKLTCEVDLRSDEPRHTAKCWAVTHIKSQKLLAHMIVPTTGLNNWKLELNSSGLGAFLVD